MTELLINIDVDNTVNDLTDVWRKRLNKSHGLNIKYEDITEYAMCDAYHMLTTNQVYRPVINDTVYDKPIHQEVVIDSRLNDKMIELRALGCKFSFVSACALYNAIHSYESLAKQFNWLEMSDFIVCPDKSRISGHVLIDDYPPNLITFNGVRMLIDQPWNKTFDCESNSVTRVKDSIEALDYIKKNLLNLESRY